MGKLVKGQTIRDLEHKFDRALWLRAKADMKFINARYITTQTKYLHLRKVHENAANKILTELRRKRALYHKQHADHYNSDGGILGLTRGEY